MKKMVFIANTLLKKPAILGFIVFALLLLLHNVCKAETTVPTVGDIAESLMTGTDIVTKLLLAACFVIGIGLIITGLIMYNAHRKNPKFLPLDRVFTYIVLGLFVVAIPFFGKIFGPTSSTIDVKNEQAAQYRYIRDIDAPLEVVKQ